MSDLELVSTNTTGHSGCKLLFGVFFLLLQGRLVCSTSFVGCLVCSTSFVGASECSSCYSITRNILVLGTGMTGFFSDSGISSLTL